MFSPLSLPKHTQPHKVSYYTPQKPSPLSSSPLRSSPLSPRNTNVPTCTPLPHGQKAETMSPSPPLAQSSDVSALPSPVSASTSPLFLKRQRSKSSKWPTKSNPLFTAKSADNTLETRRMLFLRKVREESERKRWENRGGDDEIMRVLWMAEERKLVERVEREAKGLTSYERRLAEGFDENEMAKGNEMVGGKRDGQREAAMADEVARQEEEDLETLLAMNEVALSKQHYGDHICSSTEMLDSVLTQCKSELSRPEPPYGSDEEDYDNLFMEVIMNEQQECADDDLMDIS